MSAEIEKKVAEYLKKNPDPKDENEFHKFAETVSKEHGIAEETVYKMLGSLLSGGKSKGEKKPVDSKELAMGIKVEMEHTNNKILAEKIARDHIEEIPDYYSRLASMEKTALQKAIDKVEKVMKEFKAGTLKSSSGAKVTDKKQALAIAISEKEKAAKHMEVEDEEDDGMEGKEKKMNKAFVHIHGNVFLKLEKAGNFKYIKRIPKPTGKGYIYFYNQQQVKDYQKTGKVPEQKGTERKERSGILGAWSALADFFGITGGRNSDETKFRAKIQEKYSEHKDKIPGTDISKFAQYMNEYLTNKEKWDAKFSKEPSEKKESGPKTDKPKSEKTDKSGVTSGGGQKWDISLMKKIAGIVEGEAQKPREDIDIDLNKMKSVKIPKEIKAKGIDSKEYKQWVKDNWEKDSGAAGEKGIETDPSKIVEIKNSIAEGEMILKSGKKISGKKMTPEELASVQKSVDNSKRKIGIDVKEKTWDEYVNQFKSPDNFSTMPEGKTLKEFIDSLPDEPDESKIEFVRVASKEEKKGGKERDRGYEKIPQKKGFNVIYKPYGEKGAGYYYAPLSKKTPKLELETQYEEMKSGKSPLASATEKLEEAVKGGDKKKEDNTSAQGWEPSKASKEGFKIRMGSGFEDVSPKDIKSSFKVWGEDVFVIKSKQGGYSITEKKTGLKVGMGENPNAAIENAKNALAVQGEKRFKDAIKYNLEQNTPQSVEFKNTEKLDSLRKKRDRLEKKFDKMKWDSSIGGDNSEWNNTKKEIKKINEEISAMQGDAPLSKAISLLSESLEKANTAPVGAISPDGTRKKAGDGKWVPVAGAKKESAGLNLDTKKKTGTTTKPGKSGGNPEEKGKKSGAKPEEKGKKPEKKPEEKKPKDSGISEERRGVIKSALKKMANILAEALSGRDVNQPTGAAVEQSGENIKEVGKQAAAKRRQEKDKK